jgi:nucleoside-diphosphate-sugar epimerase
MRVVITGASGNVGTALLRVLPAEHQVVGMVRRSPAQQGVYRRADGAHSTCLRTTPSLNYVGCLRAPTSSCISRGGFNRHATRDT